MKVTTRGLWSDPSVPKSGWVWLRTEDLGHCSHTCEMCRAEYVRYVHHLYHSELDQTFRVGCVCAGHMQGDLDAAREREAPLRLRANRRRKWAMHGWFTLDDRDVKRASIYTVEVFETPEPHFRIIDRVTGEVWESRRTYLSLDDVKAVTWDAVEWLKQR